MSEYTEMVRLMKRAAVDAVESGKPCDVLFGTVQGVSPLEVFVEMGMVLQADELIVGERLTDHRTVWEDEEGERRTATVFGGLKTGEGVILLRKQNGQQFVVLDRVVSV